MNNIEKFQSDFYVDVARHFSISLPVFTSVEDIKKTISQLTDACNTIFKYTYDHLSKRDYQGCKIAKIASVEDTFLEVALLLEQVSFFYLIESIEECFLYLSNIYCILHALARLGGARAVLSGNAIELMTTVKFYMKSLEAKII
jgi:hypothetical protein